MQLQKFSLALAGAFALAACSPDVPLSPTGASGLNLATASAGKGSYIVTFKGGVPTDFADRVAALGGSVEFSSSGAGIATISGLDGGAANQLASSPDVSSVEGDIEFDAGLPSQDANRIEVAADAAAIGGMTAMATPDKAAAYSLQWTYRAISAPTAWAAGKVGSAKVRVAILDSGIDDKHWDLAGRVDTLSSVSFAPSDTVLMKQFFGAKLSPWIDLNGHGTHVASTVSSNARVFAGVTQKTTLMAVKVLGASGSGSGNAIAAGIVYAAEHGADVINMSLGGGFFKAGGAAPAAYNRITAYARKMGVTIVVAAGNDALDLDHTGGSFYSVWCDSPNVVCVSATGPFITGTTVKASDYLDSFATFSNFGSAINVAAPGGNLTYSIDPKTGKQVLTGISFVVQACSRFALDHTVDDKGTITYAKSVCAQKPTSIFTSGQVGTSQATPHVSGLAALLVAEYGRSASQIRARLQQSADDLGKSGSDPYYGRGRINVAHALGL